VSLARGGVFVTGGAGFLGSHLCKRLLGDGHDVICRDNFFPGTKDNIAHLLDNPRFELMRHDVTCLLTIDADEADNPAACPAPPTHDQRDPVQDHQDQRARRHQHARTGQAHAGADIPCLHQRGLRRPRGASAPREPLRQGQPDRPALGPDLQTGADRPSQTTPAGDPFGERSAGREPNLDAKRDWGHARDYVIMQWLMPQQDEPEDFVIATGEQHSVREFVTVAAKEIGIEVSVPPKRTL
jgi:hypothetical protein